MNREATERYITDLQIREAAKRAYVKPIGYGDLLQAADRQVRDSALTYTVAMLALAVAAAVALWFFNPAPEVVGKIHQFAGGF